MKRLKEAVQKVLKSAIRVTLNLFQGLIIRKMRSRNKFGMTLLRTFDSFLEGASNFFFIEPLDDLPFVYLMNLSYLVLTDSGESGKTCYRIIETMK
jgi:UDP-N-acetylglucosamine 2-epimerase